MDLHLANFLQATTPNLIRKSTLTDDLADYMAASRRSPLMRDQWRFEGAYPDRQRDRDGNRDRNHRRQRSPGSKRRGPATDRELTAAGEGDTTDPSGFRSKVKLRDSSWERGRPQIRTSLRLPPSEDKAALREFKRSRDLSEERSSERYRRQRESPPPVNRQHPRSTSAHRHRPRGQKRGASRSPKRSHRSDRPTSRHRARAYSPRRSPGRKHRSRRHNDHTPSPERSNFGSYVPSSYHRRSRSPARRKVRSPLSRRLSPYPHRTEKYRYEASPQPRSDGRRSSPGRHCHSSRVQSQQPSPLRRASPDKSRISAVPRRHSPFPSQRKHHLPRHSRQSSRSPSSGRASSQKGDEMRSTRPIQSILEDDSRPPSPPRPIPSFDADNSGSANDDTHMREAFPMHGMKANDMQSTPRPRRPNIDTRQSYATSPQYMTPNSSHHGSPQSGSPFGTSRGGWGPQQQHFHGQHG